MMIGYASRPASTAMATNSVTSCQSGTAPQALRFGRARVIGGALDLACPDGVVDEGAFGLGELQSTRRGPTLVVVEPRSREEVTGIATRCLPLVHGDSEARVRREILAALVDPVAQPVPLGEQSFVGDLDGWRTGGRIAVEGEQAIARECIDRRLEGDDVDVERGELGRRDPAAADDRTRNGGNAQEELPSSFLFRSVEVCVERFGAAGHRFANAADPLVRGDIEDRSGPLVEEFGERVLEQRQRVRLAGDVGDQPTNETRFDRHVELAGGQGRRRREVVGAHRHDVDDVLGEEGSEARRGEGPVVEVGAHRNEDVDPVARILRGAHERGEEAFGLVGIGEGEQLLELVDDEQQAGSLGVDQPNRGFQEPRFRSAQLGERCAIPVAGNTRERRFELGERLCSRLQDRDADMGRVATKLRKQSGLHGTRFSRSARPDDRSEGSGAGHPLGELLDEPVLPEETRRIRLAKRAQAHEWVLDAPLAARCGRDRGLRRIEVGILQQDLFLEPAESG